MLLNLVSGPLNAAVGATASEGMGGIALRLAALLVGGLGIIYGVVVTVAIVRAATLQIADPRCSYGHASTHTANRNCGARR